MTQVKNSSDKARGFLYWLARLPRDVNAVGKGSLSSLHEAGSVIYTRKAMLCFWGAFSDYIAVINKAGAQNLSPAPELV